MREKILLEPREIFNKAIIAENGNNATYCFYKIQEILMNQFKNEKEDDEDALLDMATEWFWYNIEPLTNYYNIKFKYKINKYFLIKIYNKNKYEYLKSKEGAGKLIYSCKESAERAIKEIKNSYPALTKFIIEEKENEY